MLDKKYTSLSKDHSSCLKTCSTRLRLGLRWRRMSRYWFVFGRLEEALKKLWKCDDTWFRKSYRRFG